MRTSYARLPAAVRGLVSKLSDYRVIIELAPFHGKYFANMRQFCEICLQVIYCFISKNKPKQAKQSFQPCRWFNRGIEH
jgi:hypothetical protein